MLGPLISGRANRPVKAATIPSVKPEYQVSTAVGLATHSVDEGVAVYSLAALQRHKNKIPFRIDPNLCHFFSQA